MKEVRYIAPPGSSWLHYLHGNVPGHQLDWICRPRGMPGGVTPQHVQHLLDLVQVHDVPGPSEVTLTFANLSLKDTTWRPGHGGLGVVTHFRIPASLDHGGRKNPRFIHALVGVDLPLDRSSIESAVKALFQATLADRAAPDRPVDWWYARYLAAAEHGEQTALDVLESYFASFGRLDVNPRGPGGPRWALADSARLPREIRVRCGPRTPETWSDAVESMVGLASVLYWSKVPWAAITTGAGRGGDDGLVIRFLFGPPAPDEDEIPLSNLPREPEQLALALLPLVLVRDEQFVSALAVADPVTGSGRARTGRGEGEREDAGVEAAPSQPAFDPGEPVDLLGWLPPPEGEGLAGDRSDVDLFDEDEDDEILETEGPIVPMDMDALAPSEEDEDAARPLPPPVVGVPLTAQPSHTMPPRDEDEVPRPTPPITLVPAAPARATPAARGGRRTMGEAEFEELLEAEPAAPIAPTPPPIAPAPPPIAPTPPPVTPTPPEPVETSAPPPPPPPMSPVSPALVTALPDTPTMVPPRPDMRAAPAQDEPMSTAAWVSLCVGGLLGAALLVLVVWMFWGDKLFPPVDPPDPDPSHRVSTPPVEPPPVEPPPVEPPPVEPPPVETPPVETPPVETPPVETPPVETPAQTPAQQASTPRQTGGSSATQSGAKASKGGTSSKAETTPPKAEPKGTVQLDAAGVEVRAGGRRLESGANSLTVGSYKLTARFSELEDPMPFGSLEVVEGKTLQVRCSSATYTCSIKPGS